MSFPSATLFAAVGAVTRVMQALQKDKSFDAVKDEFVALPDYYNLVGLQAQTDKEADYLAAAREAVAKVRRDHRM